MASLATGSLCTTSAIDRNLPRPHGRRNWPARLLKARRSGEGTPLTSTVIESRVAAGAHFWYSPRRAGETKKPGKELLLRQFQEPRDGSEVHVGMIFGFVVENNTDLPVGDLRRTIKGRVFLGNNAKNPNWETLCLLI